MNRGTENQGRGFRKELRLIGERSLQVWRLLSRRHKLALAGATGVMAVGSACNTGIALLLGLLVNAVEAGVRNQAPAGVLFRTAVLYLSFLGGAYLLREVLNVVRRYLVENACTRIEKDLTVGLIAHLLKIDLQALSTEKVGSLHGRMTRAVSGFVRFIRLSFLDFFPALAMGGFALVAALCKQPRLGLLMAAVIPCGLVLVIWQLLSQKGVRLELLHTKESLDGTVVEQLNGIDYIRASHTHHREVERVAAAAETVRAKEIRHHFEMSLFGCAKALNEGLFHVLVLALAIYLAVHGQIAFGDILTFSMLFLSVMSPLAEVHRALDESHEASLLVGDYLQLMNEPEDRSFEPVKAASPDIQHGQPILVTENLRVEFPCGIDGKRKTALNGVSINIRHGETIGVAGRSGSGKSTWLRVLMRLAHPTSGEVRIGGRPLECISRESIGSLVGYVSQTPFVFAGTVAENIAYGCEGMCREDIEKAARMACIHDEVMAMPNGYDETIAEGGKNLSGGQRQRLALARIFLKNPPILILDEGTSALDNISERYIQRAVAAAREDRTVILVAHRLSTLRDADRILVFDEGRVAERGTYEELVRRGGVFTELVRSAGGHVPETPRIHQPVPHFEPILHTAVS